MSQHGELAVKNSFRCISDVRRRAESDCRAMMRDWYALCDETKRFNFMAGLCSRDVWDLARDQGPLGFVPVLVKDNFNVCGMTTTAGSLYMPTNQQQVDADAVSRLRQAGAVVVGKSTLSELSGFVSTRLPSGFSLRFGQTINSAFPNTSPGGSSSGSASAVACGLVPLALGTETNGSIMIPAMRHRIIGFKPTHGRISTRGVVPISRHFDTVGVLANVCADVATFLAVCADADVGTSGDPVCRIGLAIGSEQPHPEQLQLIQKVAQAEHLEVLPVKMPAAYESYKTVCSTDIREDMTRWLKDYGDGSVGDFHGLVEAYRRSGYPYGADRLTDADAFVGDQAQEAYLAALQSRQTLIDRLNAVFDDNAVDAVVLPSYDCNWTMAGFPQITIPFGSGQNIFIAMRPGRDEQLIECADRLLRSARKL